MKIKLLPSSGCADVIVISIFSVYITLVFFTIDFWSWKWKTDRGENYYTFMPPTFSVTFDWDRFMKFRLPPRFKIYHNVSEDYFFIKERFCFFWYRTMTTLSGYEYYTVDRYVSLEAAEAKIQFTLFRENQPKTPDEIKLVKQI